MTKERRISFLWRQLYEQVWPHPRRRLTHAVVMKDGRRGILFPSREEEAGDVYRIGIAGEVRTYARDEFEFEEE